ncbi:transducin/WD40 repeat-like superfamily protein [Wolffia australiana]
MHRVASTGNASNSSRPRKEKRLTYVLNSTDDSKHCAGVNCLALYKPLSFETSDYLFTGSRDGTLKRWALGDDTATCSATFESHVDWVNDIVLVGDKLVSCSSDTTIKVWNCLSESTCVRTLRQHSDYVISLAFAGKNNNIVASGGLGGEVFIWDIEAAVVPVSKSVDLTEEESSNGTTVSGNSGIPVSTLRSINSSSSISAHATQSIGYSPVTVKGHKDSVYALAMNDSGTLLVSGGTEKVIRVWDPRTGLKNMKMRGHSDNIRALLLDSSGRYCLSGSSDSMIRLWDLGQQRCIHSYAVHTDSVWALASTPNFSHVYSGGRDLSLYLTDLTTRESLLLCKEEHPILQLALKDDDVWVATTDSSVHRWPSEGLNPQKLFERGNSFLAGNLSFTRSRTFTEGSSPDPVYTEPSFTIPGTPGIVQHEILNNRRQVLTKDAAGSVKLWEITKGTVVEDYGEVSFDEKKEELFEMVSIPAWFTVDTRLGNLSVHLDTPQCFSAEMYAVDLNIPGASEEHKINLAQETLRGLLSPWLAKRKQRSSGPQVSANGGDLPSGKDATKNHSHSNEVDDGVEGQSAVLPAFEFSRVFPPSIITEGSQGGPWRKKLTELDGSEDEKDLPWWCLDSVLKNRMPPRENAKCSFYLHPYEGSSVQVLTQGKLVAPRILRIHKVISYVVEKVVLDTPQETGSGNVALSSAALSPAPSQLSPGGSKPWQKLKPSIEILCNNQVLLPEMSLATVRAYIWKKPDDLVLNYRIPLST